MLTLYPVHTGDTSLFSIICQYCQWVIMFYVSNFLQCVCLLAVATQIKFNKTCFNIGRELLIILWTGSYFFLCFCPNILWLKSQFWYLLRSVLFWYTQFIFKSIQTVSYVKHYCIIEIAVLLKKITSVGTSWNFIILMFGCIVHVFCICRSIVGYTMEASGY